MLSLLNGLRSWTIFVNSQNGHVNLDCLKGPQDFKGLILVCASSDRKPLAAAMQADPLYIEFVKSSGLARIQVNEVQWKVPVKHLKEHAKCYQPQNPNGEVQRLVLTVPAMERLKLT